MHSFAGPVQGAADAPPPPAVTAEPLVAVEALRPFVSHVGGGWNAGEVAAFPPSVARSLIERGVARALDRPQTEKAPAAPPAHKQVKRPGVQK